MLARCGQGGISEGSDTVIPWQLRQSPGPCWGTPEPAPNRLNICGTGKASGPESPQNQRGSAAPPTLSLNSTFQMRKLRLRGTQPQSLKVVELGYELSLNDCRGYL